ncbi:cobyric acid synthase [Fundidesulfovibrio butyratiphilus]
MSVQSFAHGGDVASLAREAGCLPGEVLDFSANINPLGPPEWLRPVLSAAVSDLVRYPDPQCRAFLAAARERLGVPVDSLVAGNGVSELLHTLCRVLADRGIRRAVIPAPCYVDYAQAAVSAGLTVETVLLDRADGFACDSATLADRPGAAAGGPGAVFLGSPNNPTGRVVPAAAILDLARRLARSDPGSLVVVDEAFGSFVEGFESLAACGEPNVVVLASLTKMYAVPGLRLGLLIAPADVAADVRAAQPPWTVNALAQAVGVRAMRDADFEARCRACVSGLRQELAEWLGDVDGMRVLSGQANYLFCHLDTGRASDLRARLLRESRVAVRDCANYAGLDERYFRVAVKSREDNRRLVAALALALNRPVPGQAVRPGRTAALMVQGTSSNAGKSVLTAALCRILLQDGVRVAPFKSQNMSLNSFVTAWGEEMGRAQALQARACGLAPRAAMNPVLLKPCSDTGSQVIVMGKPVGNMRVGEYFAYKPQAFERAKRAYDELAAGCQAMVLEGAGSPAEVNLKAHDMVNMAMAEYAGARVLLVGDIDRGGVFASLCGTMELLTESERARVGGYVLNRFRGDPSLLSSAFDFMRNATGKPVLGVVPHMDDLGLPEEDSVSFKEMGFSASAAGRELEVAVVDPPHISNFTDFDALAEEPDVSLRVVRAADDLGRPDALILPGSKNTLADLEALRERGLDRAIVDLAERGTEIVGVCAGLQMLGRAVLDPLGLESPLGRVRGLGLLDLETELAPEKTLTQAEATHLESGLPLRGYEIHHGQTRQAGPGAPCLVRSQDGRVLGYGRSGRVWGTYLHGVFDADAFRGWWLGGLRARKGLPALADRPQAEAGLERSLNRLARVVRESLDMTAVYALLGL